MAVFKVGDRVNVKSINTSRKGTIKGWKGKKIMVLLDSTTTGAISEFSLRKKEYSKEANTYVQVGWALYEGEYIYSDKNIPKKPSGLKQDKTPYKREIKKTTTKRKLNDFFTLMLKAKANKEKQFTYKGNKYVRVIKKSPKGKDLLFYKKK